MKNTTIPPKARLSKFTCPHCGAVSSQLWGVLSAGGTVLRTKNTTPLTSDALRSTSQWKWIISDNGDWIISSCENCEKICIWNNDKMIYPDASVVDEPNNDLPDDIKRDYNEAASILNKSPRGAAALLRLCVQKLCKTLGKGGKDLNKDIGELVKDGLSPTVVKAMDTLRVTGNNAVHPGELDLSDNLDVATNLFKLVNFIADKMITEPREIDSFYEDTLPKSAKDAVDRRDQNIGSKAI